MKQKVVTLLEEDVLRRAKRRAADEGRPLSDLIQDALEKYLIVGLPEPAHRVAAFQLFCEQPIVLAGVALPGEPFVQHQVVLLDALRRLTAGALAPDDQRLAAVGDGTAP